MKIGTVTIGQSPRTDIVPFLKALPNGFTFIETGALDGLSKAEIERLAPRDDQDTAVSRMKDGSEAILGLSLILPRIQSCIDQLNSKDVELIAILCSGEFPEFKSSCPIMRPSRLMYSFLDSLSNLRRVGVLVPNDRQVTPFQTVFANKGYDAIVASLSPYRFVSPKQSVRQLKREDISIVVMTCMGYTNEMKAEVKRITNKPVVTTQSLLGKAIQELR